MPHSYGSHWPQLARECKERDGHRCVRCGWQAKGTIARRQLQADHIIPRPRGKDVLANLQTLCKTCHEAKTLYGRGLRQQQHIQRLFRSNSKSSKYIRRASLILPLFTRW